MSAYMYKHFFKRLIDIVLSTIGIIMLAVPMLIIALVIKITDPGPVVFKQKRVGIHKSYFTLYKYRTMKVNTPDIPTHLLKNPEQYISGVGRVLRATSCDELLQLFNIWKGDMSIIGVGSIIVTTKKSIDFSRVVTVNSISL